MAAGQDIPNDFWNVNAFKWDEEPMSDDGSDEIFISHAVSESPVTPERDNNDDEYLHNPATLFPSGLVPDEQIPEIMLDDDSDRSSTPRASTNSNFDDSATLYHPEDSPSATSYLSHRRRHTLVASKLAAFAAATVDMPAPSGKLDHIFAVDALQTGAPPTPNHRPFGFGHIRTYSAPDLRTLRGTHDLLLEEEHMLLPAF
jgi:hypothetical protein